MALKPNDIARMLETAASAARIAGQRALEQIKHSKGTIKNNDEMVTETDVICQRLIIERIKLTFPDHGFLGEEGTNGQMAIIPPRAPDPVWWIIDPIDGTNNYANGLPCFAVSIAAFHNSRPVTAAIFDPATDSMYTAATDTESKLNNSPITVSTAPITRYQSFGIDSHYEQTLKPAISHIMELTRFRNFGSTALHLAYIAQGAMIGAVTTVTKLWDFAAGILILQNAGGKLTDLNGNDVLPIAPENYDGRNYVLLAANKKNYKDFLNIFTI